MAGPYPCHPRNSHIGKWRMRTKAHVVILAGSAMCAGVLLLAFCNREQQARPTKDEAIENAVTTTGHGASDRNAAQSADFKNAGFTPTSQPFERELVGNGGLNGGVATALISGNEFEPALRRLYVEGLGNQKAVGETRTYRESIGAALDGLSPPVAISSMACGETVCGLSLTSESANPEAFESVLSSGEDGPARIYAAVTGIAQTSSGRYEHRMWFSTSPDNARIRVPRAEAADVPRDAGTR